MYFISDKTCIYKIAFYPANKTYLILNTCCTVVFCIQVINSKQIVEVKQEAKQKTINLVFAASH